MSTTNIWIATAENREDAVKALIASHEYTPNSRDQNGYTPMHAAASYGYVDLLRYLVSQGGNVNVQDNDGDTPLHHTESFDAAYFLVNDQKADYSIRNNDGQTALEVLQEDNEFPELIKYLQNLQESDSSHNSEGLQTEEQLKLPNGEEVKVYLSKLSEDDSPELAQRRQALQKIMTEDISEEEKEAKLRSYVLDVLSHNMNSIRGEEEDHDPKRRRED
ncbi:DEKNAAC105606 [Brettanomyces naardenensis]|uniref:DEKNAAC105606 n=1 Tax=Brettanomyces naardenensis TaxID=13370 RepID=A0A448YTS2_BRENA|nr:DEKNAAC105606 [Brettanomyces naardenensis]